MPGFLTNDLKQSRAWRGRVGPGGDVPGILSASIALLPFVRRNNHSLRGGEWGGFYCFLTDFFFFHYKLSVPAVVGDALVAAGVFWGALVTVGWLEVMLGVVGGEHWRAVLLVMRGQWTCNKHIG